MCACVGLVFGCRTLETPVDLGAALAAQDRTEVHESPSIEPASTAAAAALEIPAELADEGWCVAPPDAETGDPPAYRWQNASLAALLSQSAGQRFDLTLALADTNPVVVANASILLARAGEDEVERCLLEVIRDGKLKLALRRAAVETLARLDSAVAGPALAEMLDEVVIPNRDDYSVELHSDLLVALVRHIDAATSTHFAAALRSADAEVRQAALQAYTTSLSGVLPAAAVELRRSRSTRACRGPGLPGRATPSTGPRIRHRRLVGFSPRRAVGRDPRLGQRGRRRALTELQRLLCTSPRPSARPPSWPWPTRGMM